MKRFFSVVTVCLLLVACGTTKIERQAERTFKGSWTLNTITYPNNSGFVDVTLFQDATANCFRNSQWNFVSNNNKGVYTLTGANCNSGTRNFSWMVQEENPEAGLYDFTLKPIGEGENARRIDTGYRLNLVSLTDTNMIWEQTVSYEGKPFKIRMSFTKM
ncbi:lipocalin family protein [Mesonia aestuariivivens]|uniref:Lipocalin family protein n=1 Tax=Mesonia aestuariivivens TaxID=2796128 RepID=A0ABS6VYV2_9FLAO|nr:lipocalin family protein [Mesonia aestuariivivens]MBW2960774.1 lipocalin family protein [Mesonia aestuariivivens]